MNVAVENSRKKLLFIVNPVAGKSAIKSHLLSVCEIFQRNGYEITVRVTLSSSDAKAFAKECAGFDRVICSGGDGTLSEVVNGIIDSGENVPIGFIPCGTTNDFADTLGLSTNIVKAAEFAALTPPCKCDVGCFNGKFFTYTAAFGLFSEVSYITPQSIKNTLGRAAYLLNGAESMLDAKPHPMRISIVGEVIEGEFLFGMISNSKSIGGFKGIGGLSVELSDGLFEAVFVRMPKNIQDIQLIMRAFVQKDLRREFGVYSVKCNSLTIESFGETPWTLDGDFGGSPSVAEISVLPGAVSYIADI